MQTTSFNDAQQQSVTALPVDASGNPSTNFNPVTWVPGDPTILTISITFRRYQYDTFKARYDNCYCYGNQRKYFWYAFTPVLLVLPFLVMPQQVLLLLLHHQ